MTSTTDRLDIRIPSDLKRELQQEAERQDRSMAWVLLDALRAYLPPKPTK